MEKILEKANVIMLPSLNAKTVYKKSVLWKHNETLYFQKVQGLNFQKQELYIISNEVIKENDWYYSNGKTSEYSIHQCTSKRLKAICKEYSAQKVIATTDQSLVKNKVFSHYSQDLMKVAVYKEDTCLFQLHDSFAEAYVKANGKIDIIQIPKNRKDRGLNISNNYLDIYPFKEKVNYSKEDVIALCKKAYDTGDNYRLWLDKIAIGMGENETIDKIKNKYSFNKWCENNL